METTKHYLDLKAVVILIIVTSFWGFNHPAIKISNQGVSPIFASTLRSIIASVCGLTYCLRKQEKVLHKDVMLIHGVRVGLLLGVEFACIYFGLLYTDAARSVLFVDPYLRRFPWCPLPPRGVNSFFNARPPVGLRGNFPGELAKESGLLM